MAPDADGVTRLVVTCGEPAGIGPELCLKLAATALDARIAVCADLPLLREQASLLGLDVSLQPLDDPRDPPPHRPGTLAVWPHPLAAPARPGTPDPRNARHVIAMLDSALDACREGHFDAMVTAPVQKSVINDAGIAFSGHTEYLAARLGAARPVMLLVAGSLRVALATTHLPLRNVPDALSTDALLDTLSIMHRDLSERFGIHRPRILVCGLNPHAGEGGHLGHEDEAVIRPAVNAACARGVDARGPVPADTAFTPRSLADCDAVLAMYHDQGLPVLKASGFGSAVNVTLGLPVLRSSVDHGTALDIAGRGIADAGSLRAAVALAAQLAGEAQARR